MPSIHLSRRSLLGAAGLVLCPASALLAAPAAAAADLHPSGPLHFEVWRNNSRIGVHNVTFHGDDYQLTAQIEAEMLIKLGPVPLFNYKHRGTEIWRAGQFASLETRSVTNGKVEALTAEHRDGGIVISTVPGRSIRVPGQACPLTHWNAAVFEAPLFNPETGELLHESVARGSEIITLHDGLKVDATCYRLRGKVDIADWYDSTGVWVSLRGKATDGSSIEYRRV
jgi:hypothetical protein